MNQYHTIEKILTEFKNGATYSDTIEKIESLLTAQTTEFVALLKDFLVGIESGEARQLIEQALRSYTHQPQ